MRRNICWQRGCRWEPWSFGSRRWKWWAYGRLVRKRRTRRRTRGSLRLWHAKASFDPTAASNALQTPPVTGGDGVAPGEGCGRVINGGLVVLTEDIVGVNVRASGEVVALHELERNTGRIGVVAALSHCWFQCTDRALCFRIRVCDGHELRDHVVVSVFRQGRLNFGVPSVQCRGNDRLVSMGGRENRNVHGRTVGRLQAPPCGDLCVDVPKGPRDLLEHE
jgi:hypothetical protein